jgi:uncharacterized cupin superfamily protein
VTAKIEIDQVPIASGSRYPAPYDAPCRERVRRRLGDALGLTRFGHHRQNREPRRSGRAP